jgi:hypothetical protein
MIKFIKFIFILSIGSVQLTSCGKSGNESSFMPAGDPNAQNPQVGPPRGSDEPVITAQVLSERIKNKWSILRGQTYSKEVLDKPTGKIVKKNIRYLPQDVRMAFCFPDYKNEEIFSNFDPYQTGFELASVSKLFTSLWAIESRKQNYVLFPKQFKTYFSYNVDTGNLYIKGSFDPFFGIDRLEDALQIIQGELKRRGELNIKPVQKITTYNFVQLPIYTNQSSYELKIQETSQALALSPLLAQKSVRSVVAYLKKRGNPFFTATDIDALTVDNNQIQPSVTDANSIGNFVNITSFQRPLNHLLIFLNTFSHNLGSDLIYQLLGGNKIFENFLVDFFPPEMSSVILHGKHDSAQHLGYDPEIPFAFYNGSGLPYSQNAKVTDLPEIQDRPLEPQKDLTDELLDTESANSRMRNKATCQLIFKTLEGIQNSRLLTQSSLEDILPVNGTGTLKRSISVDIPKGTFVGKTGSLNNLMTLAGILKTNYGNRPFFLSFFRNNLDEDGNYRPDAFAGNASIFIRSTVTTELVKIMFDYYKKHGVFSPNPDLLAQLNIDNFLSRSFSDFSAFL